MINLLDYFTEEQFDYYTKNSHTDDLEDFIEVLVMVYKPEEIAELIDMKITFLELFNSWMQTLPEEETEEESWDSEY
tara:strand:- start:32 stop:262 length:231 start_codon:yes stop_codon:yes gene_type:complete